MLPTVSLVTFSAVAFFLYPFLCLCKAVISSLDVLDNSLDLAIFLTCNETLYQQSRYLRCSIFSTPDATNEALDWLHQVCLRPHLIWKMCALMRNSIQGGWKKWFSQNNWISKSYWRGEHNNETIEQIFQKCTIKNNKARFMKKRQNKRKCHFWIFC